MVATLFQQLDDDDGLAEPFFTTQNALTSSLPVQLTLAVMLPPLVTLYGLIVSLGVVGVVSITSANDLLDTGDILPDVFLTYAT